MSDLDDYAKAIAIRIADEWNGREDFPEDAVLLEEVLTRLFLQHPEECERLIGTGIIEEDYFDPL